MRFIQTTFFAVAALAGLVMAGENPIIFPDASSLIVAGTPFTITWTPTTPGTTLTFTLRQGPSDNLKDVEIIVSGTANDGTYEWTPEKTLPAGNNYAILVTDSKGNINYTPLISIASDVPAVKSSSTVASTSTTAKVSATAASTSTSTTAKVSASASSTSSAAATASAIMTQGYSNTTMSTMITSSYSNSTATASATGNLTHSSTRSSSPSTTEDPAATATTATGAASSLLKSPLALVVCVLGAVLYLN